MHALINAQLAPVLQHAKSYPGNVARVVQARVRTTLILQSQLLQHGAQLRLRARDLTEAENWSENCGFCRYDFILNIVQL